MKEFIIREKYDLYDAMEEIMEVWKVSKIVKLQASSVRSKSKNQLGYYWAVILPTLTKHINETGVVGMKVSKSDVNEILNRKFFYQEVMINDEMVRIPKSKSGATLEQMREFIDNVLDYCTNIGVYVPPPMNGSIYD